MGKAKDSDVTASDEAAQGVSGQEHVASSDVRGAGEQQGVCEEQGSEHSAGTKDAALQATERSAETHGPTPQSAASAGQSAATQPASAKPQPAAPSDGSTRDFHGRLIRKLCLVFLAFIAVGVALNCALSFINARATYIDAQSERLAQVGAYVIDSASSSIDLNDAYDLWVTYEDFVKTQDDRAAVYAESVEITEKLTSLSEEIDTQSAEGQTASADEQKRYDELMERGNELEAAYDYLAIQDMLSRLTDVFQVGHISIYVPDATSKTVTYITQSKKAQDATAAHELFETASYAEGHDALWKTLETNSAMTTVERSQDGSEYLMYCVCDTGQATWVIEVAMSNDDLTTSLTGQMLATAVVSLLAFALCLAAMLAVLRGTLVHPIEVLASHVRTYARGKDPQEAALIRSEKLTRDEVGSLALDTADMIDEIREYVLDVSRLSAERERVASELAVAHRIQLSALPQVEPPFTGEKGFALGALMDPAKEVGGDFYDFFMVDETHCALLIADVSGKGVPAALFMMRAKTLLRQLLSQGEAPAEAMAHANDGLVAYNDEEMFVTVWLAVLDLSTGKLSYSNGGHNPPVLHHADGTVEWMRNRSGLFLGSFAGVPYRGHELQMAEGDTLVLYTDGVTEAVDERETYYGDERLYGLLEAQADERPEGFVRIIRQDVAAFAGNAPQADDITVLALRYEGGSQQ